MSSNEQFEREFEDFLEQENSRVAALYRKLPRAEPDAKLDAAVQAMARRAQTAAPRARARRPRWIPVLSAAAVVTLAAGIAFRIGPTVWQERQTGQLQKSAAENKVSPPMSAPTAAVEKTPSDADAFKDKAAPKPAVIPPPPAAVMTNAAPAARAPSRTVQAPPARVDAPTPQAFPSPALEQEKKSVETGASANDAVQAQAKGELDEQILDRKRDQPVQTAPEAPTLKLRAERAATAPATEPAASAAPPPAREEAAAAQAELSSAPPPAQAASSGTAAESTRAAPAAKTAHLAPVRSKDPNASLYPEHWLANIRTMLRENRHDEALRSLAEFRKMYPDYHLPDDLRDLK